MIHTREDLCLQPHPKDLICMSRPYRQSVSLCVHDLNQYRADLEDLAEYKLCGNPLHYNTTVRRVHVRTGHTSELTHCSYSRSVLPAYTFSGAIERQGTARNGQKLM